MNSSRSPRSWLWWNLLAVVLFSSLVGNLFAQSSGPHRGWLVLAGGAYGPGVVDRFRELAGGPTASVIYIPSASSGIKLPSGFIWIPPEEPDATKNTPEFEKELAALFGMRQVRVVHSRDAAEWNSDGFVEAIRATAGVWISEGNAGRLASIVLGTRSEKELHQLLERDGVIGGTSAGAIFAGSVIVRGRPDKPVVVARGYDRGLALLTNVVINPHLTEAKREAELIGVVDSRPALLGIGIDERAAIVVRQNRIEVIGAGRVAIYDDKLHGREWYYYVEPGSVFDLSSRRVQ